MYFVYFWTNEKQRHRINGLKGPCNYATAIQNQEWIKSQLTSADPRRYASADFLIFASDSRRGPDAEAFSGSSLVSFNVAADFSTIATVS